MNIDTLAAIAIRDPDRSFMGLSVSRAKSNRIPTSHEASGNERTEGLDGE